jgi:hypothetical protein
VAPAGRAAVVCHRFHGPPGRLEESLCGRRCIPRANVTGERRQRFTPGLRNNNPLNLTESEFTRAQPGFAGTDSGGRYAKFETPEAGMAAGQHLLGSYLQRGFDTPAEIIERWAPAKENGSATANYVSYVAKRLGIGAHDPVSPDQVPVLMEAMAEFENGGRRAATSGQ